MLTAVNNLTKRSAVLTAVNTTPDGSVHLLMDAVDREVRLPFGWFFLMTHGHWVDPDVDLAIAKGLKAQHVRLPDRDASVLLRWADRTYGFESRAMNDVISRALVSDPEIRRALQLDALAAILPMEQRDQLAELLTLPDGRCRGRHPKVWR